MITRAALVIAAAATAGGCDDRECKQRLATLQERLEAAIDFDSGPRAVAVELVESREARPLEPGRPMVISVLHDGLQINNRTLPATVDDNQLAEMIALEREAYRLSTDGSPLVVRMWVDRRAPIAAVRQVAKNFRLDTDLRLVARRPGKLEIPPPPERVAAAVERIEATDPSGRVSAVAALVKKALGRCESATAVFGKLGAAAVDARSAILRDDLVPAITGCGCKAVDVPLLEEVLLRTLGARSPRLGWIPLDRGKLVQAANVAGLYE